jgi:hypothetical protein
MGQPGRSVTRGSNRGAAAELGRARHLLRRPSSTASDQMAIGITSPKPAIELGAAS